MGPPPTTYLLTREPIGARDAQLAARGAIRVVRGGSNTADPIPHIALDPDLAPVVGADPPLALAPAADVDISPITRISHRTRDRTLLAAIIVAVMLALAAVIPAPFYVSAGIIPARVPITKDDPGSLGFGLVRLYPTTWLSAGTWWVRSHFRPVMIYRTDPRSDKRRDATGVTADTTDQANYLAYLAASNLAGKPIDVEGDGVLVLRSPEGDPLSPGDVIVDVDGTPAQSLRQIEDALTGRTGGDYVPVTLSDGRSSSIKLYPDPSVETRYILPTTLRTRHLKAKIPKGIPRERKYEGIEGPSYGLTAGLQYYEELSGDHLLRGRKVIATGMLTEMGRVEDVGGVAEKAAAAARVGNHIMLVPVESLGAAFSKLPKGSTMQIVGVSSLAEAVAALKLPMNGEAIRAYQREQREQRDEQDKLDASAQ